MVGVLADADREGFAAGRVTDGAFVDVVVGAVERAVAEPREEIAGLTAAAAAGCPATTTPSVPAAPRLGTGAPDGTAPSTAPVGPR